MTRDLDDPGNGTQDLRLRAWKDTLPCYSFNLMNFPRDLESIRSTDPVDLSHGSVLLARKLRCSEELDGNREVRTRCRITWGKKWACGLTEWDRGEGDEIAHSDAYRGLSLRFWYTCSSVITDVFVSYILTEMLHSLCTFTKIAFGRSCRDQKQHLCMFVSIV